MVTEQKVVTLYNKFLRKMTPSLKLNHMYSNVAQRVTSTIHFDIFGYQKYNDQYPNHNYLLAGCLTQKYQNLSAHKTQQSVNSMSKKADKKVSVACGNALFSPAGCTPPCHTDKSLSRC